MFFTYLRRELRRRMRQAVFIALGLALGIGLVITVTAAASGVKTAQGSVLKALYGVGTDVTVTKTPAAGVLVTVTSVPTPYSACSTVPWAFLTPEAAAVTVITRPIPSAMPSAMNTAWRMRRRSSRRR